MTVVYLYFAAQAERIGVQLVFGEKGEEALMGAAAFTRGSDATALLIQITVATPRVNQRDATELDTMLLSIYVHSLLTHTHTHLFTY